MLNFESLKLLYNTERKKPITTKYLVYEHLD